MDGVFIERIRRDYDNCVVHRITVNCLGMQKTVDVAISGMEIVGSHADTVVHKIEYGFRQLFDSLAAELFSRALENFRQTGNWDNTERLYSDAEVQAQRSDYWRRNWQEAYRQQLMGDTQGVNHGFISGNWGQNKKKDDITRKSMALLYKAIGKARAKQFKKFGYFDAKGKHGTYRFMRDDPGGVKLIEKKKYGPVERELQWSLCIQSSKADMPKGDVILSRYLDFLANEDAFLETANFRAVTTKDEAVTRNRP